MRARSSDTKGYLRPCVTDSGSFMEDTPNVDITEMCRTPANRVPHGVFGSALGTLAGRVQVYDDAGHL